MFLFMIFVHYVGGGGWTGGWGGGRDGTDNRAPRCGMNGPGFATRRGARNVLISPTLLVGGYRMLFPGVKRLERDGDHTKRRIEVYLNQPSSPATHFTGRITKNFVYYTYSETQLYFTYWYSKNTTTCFGPICGPSSG